MWRISDMWRILDFLLYAPFTLQAVHLAVRNFSGRAASQVAPSIRIVHNTGREICGYRHLVKQHCPSTTVRGSYATLCHSGEMSDTQTHLMSPYYTESQQSHNLMYTVDHTHVRNRLRMLTIRNQRWKL